MQHPLIRGKDFFEFAYDWRQDIRQTARQLAQFVESLGTGAPIKLIGHSLGTLVSRYYVEQLGGRDKVERHSNVVAESLLPPFTTEHFFSPLL